MKPKFKQLLILLTLVISFFSGCCDKSNNLGALRFDDRQRTGEILMGAHGFSRYSGGQTLQKIKSRAQTVHFTGELETRRVSLKNNDGAEITLFSLVHYGDAAFFQEIGTQLSHYDKVLYEDFRGFNKSQFGKKKVSARPQATYRKHLSSQRDFYRRAKTSTWLWADADSADFADDEQHQLSNSQQITESTATHSIANNASNVSESERRQALHLFALSLMSRDSTLPSRTLHRVSLTEFQKLKPTSLTDQDYTLVYRRNDRVVAHIQRQLSQNRTAKLAVLFGAAHSFDLVNRLLELGFREESERWQRVLSVPGFQSTWWCDLLEKF